MIIWLENCSIGSDSISNDDINNNGDNDNANDNNMDNYINYNNNAAANDDNKNDVSDLFRYCIINSYMMSYKIVSNH